MAETMAGLRRTNYCGETTMAQLETQVVVCGWVQKIRDKGMLVFIDLRDRTGIVQLAFDDRTDATLRAKAQTARSEFVLMAKGVVRRRESVNSEIVNGDIEVYVSELRILSKAMTPPFEITDKTNVKEELRLKYRYLDLRRRTLQQNLMLRHKIAQVTRSYFYDQGFLEIETPMMIKSTPEGARDYIVPSRVQPGHFYALPQSPQIYKQLLMLSGFDRYIQLARCFRDEDLRADRQPEFTQIDLEMSFVDVDDILEMVEGYISKLFHEVLSHEVTLPLPRLTYAQAMERYGSDKPDTRFAMEITDLSDLVKDSGFSVFSGAVAAGGTVRAIVAKGAAATLTRKEIDKLTEAAKGIGAKGLAYIRYAEETPNCSFAKFMTPQELTAILERLDCRHGDVALIVADKSKVTLPVLGALRNQLGRQLELIDKTKFNLLWIVEFPFFEYNEETGGWDAMHHPFTMPMEECLDKLDSDPGSVRAKAYDLVLNGVELCSGSIRISDYQLQECMFRALGLTPQEIEAKFGFLVDAYHYGAPPHGGVGIGLDRLAMTMTGAESLRDVLAFPKVQNASELMSGAPGEVDDQSLRDLSIGVTRKDI
ncbi:MAG: aspartate--tRNA ligase [Angelakisella sp.]